MFSVTNVLCSQLVDVCSPLLPSYLPPASRLPFLAISLSSHLPFSLTSTHLPSCFPHPPSLPSLSLISCTTSLSPPAAFLTQTVNLDDTTVKFEIWDTAGQERYHSLAPMYYRGAQAAIVVYDITNMVRFPLFSCA